MREVKHFLIPGREYNNDCKIIKEIGEPASYYIYSLLTDAL